MIEIRFYSRAKNEYGWMSNFSRHAFWLDGKEWKTSEHYYQAMKFPDPEVQEQIRLLEKPWQAKKAGWSYPGFRRDWEDVKEAVMRHALRGKFAAHPNLVRLLLLTEDVILIEDSPTDFYWGIGDGTGKNRLGHLLMELRADIQIGMLPEPLVLPAVQVLKVPDVPEPGLDIFSPQD